MRKINSLFRNVYRVLVARPKGRSATYCIESSVNPEKDNMTDSGLRYIVGSDILPFEPDPAIEELLCQRVKEIDRRPDTAKNSLFEIILPLFSLKQIELKMTVISLVLFIMAGIGPTNNQAPKNNLNLFFLADTLSDTSVFQLPSAQDPAGKIYYK